MLRAALALVLGMVTAACASASGEPGPAGGAAEWGDREPVVYAIVVAEVLDDLGSPPPVVFVVDRICAKAGQEEPSELTCGPTIPTDGRTALSEQLERYARVEFVAEPEEALEGGSISEGGLLLWLGPLKDRQDGEVRVGATYATALSDEAALGVNLALEDDAGSWVVTGAAGLGGCPA